MLCTDIIRLLADEKMIPNELDGHDAT